MRFGAVSLDQAKGAILAHSLLLTTGRLRKGLILQQTDVDAIHADGLTEVTVARLDAGDVAEDLAAEALARALLGPGLKASAAFTGRVNLKAQGRGLVEVDAAAVHALNLVDPAITVATLAPLTRVAAGTLVGTVKLISYGVAGRMLQRACDLGAGALRVRPVVMAAARLILTEVPQQKDQLTSKGRAAVEGRLRALGMVLAGCEVVAHTEVAIAEAVQRAGRQSHGAEMILILTGSATSDLHDTAPQGLRRAGGQVQRFGMPVDPGNLLFLGAYAGRPVIGLPGCARSPALNGADWVLERLACGLTVSDAEIAAMGVGGLLKEIPIRPQLREP